MLLQGNDSQHHYQGDAVGDQLQEADVVQPLAGSAQEGAAVPLLVLGRAKLDAPLGQPRRKIQDDAHLGDLRGLETDGAQLDPTRRAAAGFADAGDEHQQHQHHRPGQHKDGHPAELLVVDLGDDEHGHHAHQREPELTVEVVQGVSPGVGDLGGQIIHGGGEGGGQQHDQPQSRQQHHQRQEGQVDGPPGQLLLDGQISFGFSGHGTRPFRRIKVRSTSFPPAAKTAFAPLLLLSPQSQKAALRGPRF